MNDENTSLINESIRLAAKGTSVFGRYLQSFAEYITEKRHRTLAFALTFVIIVVVVRGSHSRKAEGPVEILDTENNANSAEQMDLFNYIDQEEDHHANCSKEAFAQLEPHSYDYLLKEADCGSGYVFDDTRRGKMKPVFIALYGQGFRDNFQLSGCPLGGAKCYHHSRCHFSLVTSMADEALTMADVVVVSSMDALDITEAASKSTKQRVRKVLYWREAYWNYLHKEEQKTLFDLEMGVHFTSGIVNPNYLRKPRTLVAKSFFDFLPFDQREFFALSIISNCGANSERHTYIQQLSDFLGPERVHQYGNCGNRKLPPPPLKNAAKIISKYKFYLSFENTVQSGYVSEKLFTVLNMPLLPVYLGAVNVPNITKIPSFIKAHDFQSPKHLAEYLLYLDSNPSEYLKYHLWRKDMSQFSEDYLDLIKRKFPSQAEMKPYNKMKGLLRTAGCCRLCNLAFLDEQIARRKDSDLIDRIMGQDQINREFFGGKLKARPGPKAKLTPPEPGGPPPSRGTKPPTRPKASLDDAEMDGDNNDDN